MLNLIFCWETLGPANVILNNYLNIFVDQEHGTCHQHTHINAIPERFKGHEKEPEGLTRPKITANIMVPGTRGEPKNGSNGAVDQCIK